MDPRKPGTSDAELVHAGLLGDKDSVGELIQRHWQTATLLATKVLGAPELARDAAQEAAIAAMTGLERLRSPDKFGAWFCGITLNVARRWLRQRRAELPGFSGDQVCPAPGPAEAAELADIAARVRAAIALLADGQRQAVRLYYLQGLSHREVAAELGISPAAVKARLHQARAALAPRLAHVIDRLEETTMTTSDSLLQGPWADARVTEIRLAPAGEGEQGNHIMILAETGGDRSLPIWIGPNEATALALTLESAEMPRPFTYKLAADLVSAARAEIAEVRITQLIPPIFYAVVRIRAHGETRDVDARPSDAVNLALAAGAPIRVDAALFDTRPPQRAPDLASCPVVTADIAAEHTRRIRELMETPCDTDG